MKCQDIFSMGKKKKNSKVLSAADSLGALRVKCLYGILQDLE